jgi:hypothetical protein
MIKARTKIEAMLASVILFSIVFTSVLNAGSGGPTITDSHGVRYSTICNSRGNYWNYSSANLYQAIWDCNTTKGGWVQVPYNCSTYVNPALNPYNVYVYDVGNLNYPICAPHVLTNGSIWFVPTNHTIALYWDGYAYYFQNDGSFTLP